MAVFSSSIIATIGRPSLDRAVESVLTQDVPPEELEVIVVNDSGADLPASDWRRSPRVTVLRTPRRERCVARNTGAGVALGTYLHFLDDDDWLLPGALRRLWAAARAHPVALIHGVSCLVDGALRPLVEHRLELKGNAFAPLMAGEWLPMGASLVDSRLFFAVGGFDVRLPVCQDKDLFRKIALRGELLGIPEPVAALRRDRRQSTTRYELANAMSLDSRDRLFDQAGAFARMRASAADAYWRGRWVRAYLTCVALNLRRQRYFRAACRGGSALGALLLSLRDWRRGVFWRAIVRSHTRVSVA